MSAAVDTVGEAGDSVKGLGLGLELGLVLGLLMEGVGAVALSALEALRRQLKI